MAKIYLAPKNLTPPDIKDYSLIDKAGINNYYEACKNYVDILKKTIKTSYSSVCPEAGEEIRFPVADGYACYVVVRLKPVELIHIDTGDGWHFQYANRLTASDIRKEIKKIKNIRKLFSTRIKGGMTL